ncbi:AAA family ATPase [Microbacterium sp. STN6]|uniref:AAA family ATPase n=1 Tax=Microbacterium sp. STN6 TaxID=2995588 RepID=UPI002260BC6A|nr:AAA family ATPase [Microbacterium sp. STN6]MCX7521572.1 AAA family ATPase [Microbacterium sp. STN6]
MEGYKAIRQPNDLVVRPLTLISGANSSGKSSFIQPFLMLKQTLDSAFDPGPLLLYGPNVKITDYSQLLSRGKSRQDVVKAFQIGMRQGNESRSLRFVERKSGLVIASDVVGSHGRDVTLSESLTAVQTEALRDRFANEAQQYVDLIGKNTDQSGDWSLEVYRNRCFLELFVLISDRDRKIRLNIGRNFGNNDQWVDLLRGIIHVPGLRGNPERAYARSAVGDTYPGTFETYVASIIYEWGESDGDKLVKLAAELERLGLTWKVSARRLNDASIEIMVGRLPHAQQGGAFDLVSVADVGFGVSQTLPVIVALLAAKPGQIVYIEQPEIHLHPRAQLALADSLVDAANRGVRVIAETHSSLLIRGVQTAVAERRLAASDLSLNWFGRDAETGFQTISQANVDRSGRFGDWPLDFDDVSRDADWAFLDAVGGEDIQG